MKLRAVIFDLDGLLIDSEPLWRSAERTVFGEVGIELTDAMCEETMGLRCDEVIRYWHDRFPWASPDLAAVEKQLIEEVQLEIQHRGNPLPGVPTLLHRLRDAGWPLGLASSSPRILIEAAIRRLNLDDCFATVCSAADEERGKPDPAVYLTAARTLAVEPTRCVALEDSLAGVHSACSAGLFTVAVPTESSYDDPRFDRADLKIRSLLDPALERLLDLSA